ncbi:3-oxoacyl-(acyl-carrier-protein) reductase [Marinitoga piezophila KA3]|uniref:3-oxoacyl-[acyl-carrier-protein] reductase n=1 Tax=Marinitoga piezophila (strain DSM 14283 / JCM 11233 / KA3) TaxID=443254 RepID=H2J569_MARPK|nr:MULTISPECIES: 3-oxoacyl-[acyl-carrier-protein] reductase [Marinitoga]AEX84927.1 3-oxoacyl-(acyl-carrier-protein) reductase [Marinitoga piezophila KA3]APT75433.1 short-chain dehydrogenase [Marinitoga sp. 1137]NUU97093.1 short-chain dehydrogenase [Marinitoga sp. 1138]
MRMEGKVCIVTGGARGLGKAMVEKFAKEGAKVVYACDLNEEALKDLEKEYSNVKGYVLNVTDRKAIEEFKNKVMEEEGHVDVLVNNAGITRDALIQKMSEEDWDIVIDVNLKGVFNMTQFFAPEMMKAGKGAIVNISSVVGIYGNVGQTNYAATKGGVIAMTKTWAKEFARKGAQVRVNAVAPGFIKTPMTEVVPQKVIDYVVSKTPLGKMGDPEDIANAVCFLASDEAKFITGQVLGVDGGLIL